MACLLLLSGLVLMLEIRGVVMSRKTAGQAQARLELKLQELKRCEASVPSLTEKNARLIEAHLNRGRRLLDELKAEVEESGENVPARGSVPAGRMDAFFELTNFVTHTRELAARSGIVVKSDERFGFSSYAIEGPSAELIPEVFRQRIAVQGLLETLFEAHPHRLILIQRELPAPASTDSHPAGSGRMQSAAPGGQTADFFAIDPRWSVRVPGAIDGMAFRLVFVGPTETLRGFLNRLAVLATPVAVRCIEVEPTVATEVAPLQPRALGANSMLLSVQPADSVMDSAVPVVTPGLSKFTVTVEVIDLVPTKRAMPGAAVTSPSV